MTDAQLSICKTCLNRKKEDFELPAICNLRGHQLAEAEDCTYYAKDTNVVSIQKDKQLLLRPNEKRAKYAIILVILVTLMDLVSAFSSYLQLEILYDLKEGYFVSEAALTSNDNREQFIAFLYMVVLLISIIVFIRWFRRAYYNLHLHDARCQHSEGWAAGCWFVPVLSLFRPYQIMKELEVKTSRMLSSATGKVVQANTMVIGFWWAIWIINNYIGNYIFKMSFKANTLENFILTSQVSIVSSLLGVPLGILTFFMIKTYATKERDLMHFELRKTNS